MAIKFTVNMVPRPQGRPRFTTRGKFVQAYEDAKDKSAKADVKLQAYPYRPLELLTGQVKVTLSIYMPVMKSWSKAKMKDALSGAYRPVKKSDNDNFEKLVWDALTDLIWEDDGQIVENHTYKWYSDTPRIEVEIEELKPSNVAAPINLF